MDGGVGSAASRQGEPVRHPVHSRASAQGPGAQLVLKRRSVEHEFLNIWATHHGVLGNGTAE